MLFLPERMKINKTQKLKIDKTQNTWLKKYIDMNTELRKKASNDFEKDFFKLMNNAVFGKTMENVRKHRHINLVKIDCKRNKLSSEPNYHTMKLISEYLLIIEMKKGGSENEKADILRAVDIRN